MNSQFCPACGKEIPPGAAFCPACGARSSLSPPIPGPVKKPFPLFVAALVFAVLAVVLMVVAGIVFAVFFGKSASKKEASPPPAIASSDSVAPGFFQGSQESAAGGEKEKSPAVAPSPEDLLSELCARLSSQLKAGKMPSADVAFRDGVLSLHFPETAASDEVFHSPADLLTPLLLGFGAARDLSFPAEKISVRAARPDGSSFYSEASCALVARYVRKEVSAQQFSASVRSGIAPWEPAGQTREEILASYMNRGQAFVNKDRYDLALPVFRDAHEIDPSYPKLNRALSLCLLQTGDASLAVPFFQAALRDPSDAEGTAALGILLAEKFYEKKDCTSAKKICETALGSPSLPTSKVPGFLKIRCQAAMAQNAFSEAESLAREFVARFPDSPDAQKLLAQSFLRQNKWKEGGEAVQKSCRMNPDDADSFYWLAEIQSRNKKYRDAVQSFRRVREIAEKLGQNPNEEVFVKMSYACAQSGDMAGCAEVASDGLKIYPDSKDLQTNYKVGYKAKIQKQ